MMSLTGSIKYILKENITTQEMKPMRNEVHKSSDAERRTHEA